VAFTVVSEFGTFGKFLGVRVECIAMQYPMRCISCMHCVSCVGGLVTARVVTW